MNKRTSTLTVSLFTILAGALTGCTTVSAPTFAAEGVRELESLDGRTRVVFVVSATNPNKEPIPLEQVSYRVLIDGAQVYEGVRSPETTLPGYASQSFELPAIVGSGLISAGREASYGISGSVKYHMPGSLAEVLYDSDLKIPEAPLELGGTINLGQ